MTPEEVNAIRSLVQNLKALPPELKTRAMDMLNGAVFALAAMQTKEDSNV